jgi:hypothetical protein
MTKLLTLALFASALCAQTSTVTAAGTGDVYPQYFVSTGGGIARNATPAVAEGWVSAAMQIGTNSPYYSITTVDMTSASSTIRTGLAKIFSQSGNVTLMGRLDAGVSTISPIIGNFSGGAILLYNMRGFSKKLSGIFLLGEIRITGATASTAAAPNQVNTGFYFGVGKSF